MYPVGHLALAYLGYALYARVSDSSLPHGVRLAALAVGSQLPDLVDKPLVYVGVLASGRSFAHSLIVLVPALLLAGVALARLDRRRLWPALTVGALSHLVGDSYKLVVTGQWADLRFLLWPVFPAIDYPSDGIPPWVRLLDRSFDVEMGFQLALAVAAAAIWAWSRYRRSVEG